MKGWGPDGEPGKLQCLKDYDVFVVPHQDKRLLGRGCEEAVRVFEASVGCQEVPAAAVASYLEKECLQEYKWNPRASGKLKIEYLATLESFSTHIGLPFGPEAKKKISWKMSKMREMLKMVTDRFKRGRSY